MRNLKRALSLTLASVMLLGMMVMGTSALSFNDADDISNVTAATVLEELEVMQGDGRGNFMPEQPVTRAQMAILVCRILYGDKLNVKQFEGVTQYTDVGTNDYYTGYINLATQLGIIGGYGDGRFGPDDTVTTAQAALMLSRALGYFKANELEGQDWALAAIAQATKIDMFGSLKLATNELLARDNVAEMVFNTMTKAVPVQYSERWGVYYSDSQSVLQGVKFDYADTLGYQNFDLVYDDSDTNTDDFGRPIIEWGTTKGTIKTDGNTGKITTVDITNSFIKAVNEADATYTEEVEYGDIHKALGLSGSKSADLFEDSESSSSITLTRASETKLGGNGILVQAFKKDDGTVIVTVITTYLAQADEDYDEDDEDVEITIFADEPTDATLELDDFAISDVKEDDYLLVTISDGVVKTVAPVEVMSDVTVTAARDNDYVTVDGQRYKYNGAVKESADALGDNFITDADEYDLGNGSYNLYLDSYGYVLGVEEAEGEANVKDYLIATADGTSNGYDAILKVMFMDGTKKTITVTKVGDSKASDASNIDDYAQKLKEGTFFTFKEKKGEYELTIVPKSGSGKATSPTNAAAVGTAPTAVTDGIEAKPNAISTGENGNGKTLFIADGETYTGVKNAPEVASGKDIFYVLDKNGKLLIVWTAAEGKNKSNDLVYILDVKPEVSRDNDVYTYKAIVNGKEEEIKTSNGIGDFSDPGLYEVKSYDSDNIAELETTPVTDASYASDDTYAHHEDLAANEDLEHEDGFVYVDGEAYELADSARIISVDGTTVNENVRPSSLKTMVEKGFTSVIVVREKDDADAKAIAIYVIKPAEGGGSVTPPPPAGATAATYVSTEFTTAVTTESASSKVSVTIGGKAYDVDKANDTVKKQADAWADKYNNDSTTGSGWTASVDASGAITVTYENYTAQTNQDGSGLTGGTFTDGDGSTSAAKVVFTAEATPSEVPGTNDLFAVAIDGKTYNVANTNTTAAQQLAAWVDAYNADAGNTDYTAAVGTGTDANKVVLTAKAAGEKGSNTTGMTGGTWTDGTDAPST